jgi:hypothetical protein
MEEVDVGVEVVRGERSAHRFENQRDHQSKACRKERDAAGDAAVTFR